MDCISGAPGVRLSRHMRSMARCLHKYAAAFFSVIMATINGGCLPGGGSPGEAQASKPSETAPEDYVRLRDSMVRSQLRNRDISDERVLEAMHTVPRHEFVPMEYRHASYDDTALPLALGQTISQPYIVAFMTQALRLGGKERVLEIGTGSGYQAAVLARLVADVYTVEILPQLLEKSKATLDGLNYKNIRYRAGDGYQGWPEFAPYDAIIVTAAPDHVPQPLVDQLKPGGRLILPLGKTDQELVLIEKGASGIRRQSTIPVRFVPMTGKALQGAPR